ncbi:hypothetical protein EV140_1957 [Microcella alkaliphila]|uniref:Uncharacterized protein n=1 Tax=Microcella alkaliphila TaxID=279828 RepID=A0A4Q7TJC9_9MICO|nr:hypothetical protein [Microcella alkaliphila]RZT59352.1 hypothetical protein EV140_1957 [Microcella alkaliphila]
MIHVEPLTQATSTTLTCDFCTNTVQHVAGTESPSMVEYFSRLGWIVRNDPDAAFVVICNRCRPLLEDLTIALDSALPRAIADRSKASS